MRFPIRERLVAEMSDVEKAGSFYRNVLGARETFGKATENGELVRLGLTSEQMTNYGEVETEPQYFETRFKKGTRT
jgi:hypothetical protein